MVLYLIGLGLGDVRDITVKGLEVVRAAKCVYLESYTSILGADNKEKLEEFYCRKVIAADRNMVEQNSDIILSEAATSDVAFLVVGDPFGATTHTDLVLRAVELNIPYKVIHNASIMNAVACCGLQLYNFGETVSVVMWSDTWQPDSYYDKISCNRERGLHTLCLLDIKMREQSIENMMRGRQVFEPPSYMCAHQAAHQLLRIIYRRRDGDPAFNPAYTGDSLCVALARVGTDTEQIVTCALAEMATEHCSCHGVVSSEHGVASSEHGVATREHSVATSEHGVATREHGVASSEHCVARASDPVTQESQIIDLGPPLHSLVIPGKIHPLEASMLRLFVAEESDLARRLLDNMATEGGS